MRISARLIESRKWGVARHAWRSGSGFTLIETVVAFGILALVIFSLYAALSFGFTTVRLSQEDVRADQILMQKMETLRVYHWTKIFTNGYLPDTFTAPFAVSGTNNIGVTYNGAITVTNFPKSAANESYYDTLRQVIVTLNWVSGGVQRNRSITTFVSQYGVQTYRY